MFLKYSLDSWVEMLYILSMAMYCTYKWLKILIYYLESFTGLVAK